MNKIVAKVTDYCGNVSYVSVFNGSVSYALANGIPYALSGLAKDQDGMSLRFACEQCTTVEQLVAVLRQRMAIHGKAGVESFSAPTPSNDNVLTDADCTNLRTACFTSSMANDPAWKTMLDDLVHKLDRMRG